MFQPAARLSTPSKKDTQSKEQGDPTVSIDGKTMLLGDTGHYTIDLDATQKDQAYRYGDWA